MKTVTGYICKPLYLHTGEESDEEEADTGGDEDDNWLDYSEIQHFSAGGVFVKFKRKTNCRVILKEFKSGKEHICRGHFVCTDPWWDVTANIEVKTQTVRGLILYALSTDTEHIKNSHLVHLLVNKVCKQLKFLKAYDTFSEFVSYHGLADNLTFDILEDLLEDLKEQSDMLTSTFCQSVLTSEDVQLVLRAHKYPELLCFLCQAFPLTFVSSLVSPPAHRLPKLLQASKEEPWVFGFRTIMAKRFYLFGFETSLFFFEKMGLLKSMPQDKRDALYIYTVLKLDAQHDGHTYIALKDLQQHYQWTKLGYNVLSWTEALAYLFENGVTQEERFDSKRNIFLYHNWKSEVDISSGISKMLSLTTEADPAWNVDISSPDFDQLRGDADQCSAAQKVANFPVCVLSGKGGCGKTTVVTLVIRHVCERYLKNQELLADIKNDELLKKIMSEDFGEDDVNGSIDSNIQNMFVEGNQNSFISPQSHMDFNTGVPSTANSAVNINPINLLRCSKPEISEEFLPESTSSDLTLKPNISQNLPKAVKQIDSLQNAYSSRFKDGEEHRKDSKKSYLVANLQSDLIKYLQAMEDTKLSKTSIGRKILLTAPTGKAAQLLGHKAQMKAYTLHHVIYSYRAFLKSQAEKVKSVSCQDQKLKIPQVDRLIKINSTDVWKFADVEVLFVDECSLVSLRLFATLLTILLEHSQLCKIVLLGDIRQLPSIEPGNFLGDMFTAFKDRGFGIELTTNHRAESDLIVSNATRISRQHLPLIDPSRNFHFLTTEDSETSGDPERDEEIRKLLNNQPNLSSDETSQFVAFKRSDCEGINEICCQHYNNHTTRLPKKTDQGGRKRRFDFQIGDKVCFRKNGLVISYGDRLLNFLPEDFLAAHNIVNQIPASRHKKGNELFTASAVAQTMMDDNRTEEETAQCKQLPIELVQKEDKDFPCQRTNSQEKTPSYSEDWTDDSFFQSAALQSCCTDHNVSIHNKESQTQPHHAVSDHKSLLIQENAAALQSCHRDHRLSIHNEDDVGEESQTQPYGAASDQKSLRIQEKDEGDSLCSKLQRAEVRLCNGEVFFIMDITTAEDIDKRMRDYVTLSDRDPECPRVYCCLLSSLKRECHIQHAWGRTIHTYQGSESDTVVYYVGDSANQTWKHVYTAVTRGRKEVCIVGKQSHLQQAVWRKDRPRRSRLLRRLHDALIELNPVLQKLQRRVRKANENAKLAAEKLASQSFSLSLSSLQPCSDKLSPTESITKTVEHSERRDSFPDSDDSWIKSVPEIDTELNSFYLASPSALELTLPWADSQSSSPVEFENTCLDMHQPSDSQSQTTPGKRHINKNGVDTAELKKSRVTLSLDEIVSPVRRGLQL